MKLKSIIFLIAILAAIAIVIFLRQPAQAAIMHFIYSVRVSSGLVGYWTFDGATMLTGAVLDVSGNNNTGYLMGGHSTTTQRVPGMIGQSLSFIPNDYVTISDSSSLTWTTQMSISIWMKAVTLASGQKTLVAKWDHGNRTEFFLQTSQTAADEIDLYVENACGESGGTSYVYTTTANLTVGNWYHVVATYDGSQPTDITKIKFFVNGIQAPGMAASEGSLPSTMPNCTGPINIGGEPTLAGRWFDGQIDEVRIYNRVLSGGEIDWLYKQGARQFSSKINASQKDKFTNGLIGYWSFDGPDMITGNVADLSGNNNTGYIYSGSGLSTSTQRVPGIIGQAMYFNGTAGPTAHDVRVLDSASLDTIDENFSVTMWVKPSNGAQIGNASLLRKNNAGGTDGILIGDCSTALACRASWGSGGLRCYDDTFTLTANVWQHLVIRKNGDTRNVYINGADAGVNCTNANSTITDNSDPLTIGDVQAGSKNFNGIIDEVRIYNRALTAAEIREMYESSAPNFRSQVNAPQTNTLTSGLVGYWSFDGSTLLTGAVLDSSGNNNTGYLMGGHSTSTQRLPGVIGQALNFDGNDLVSISDSATLTWTNKMSASFWMKTSTVAAGYYVLVAKWQADTNNEFFWQLNADELHFYVENSCTDNGGSSYTTTDAANLTVNTWYHVVGVYDGTQGTSNDRIKIYVNGAHSVSTQAGDLPTSMPNCNSNVTIGGDTSYSRYFKGQIDEVRIYNRALSAAEVYELYRSGKR